MTSTATVQDALPQPSHNPQQPTQVPAPSPPHPPPPPPPPPPVAPQQQPPQSSSLPANADPSPEPSVPRPVPKWSKFRPKEGTAAANNQRRAATLRYHRFSSSILPSSSLTTATPTPTSQSQSQCQCQSQTQSSPLAASSPVIVGGGDSRKSGRATLEPLPLSCSLPNQTALVDTNKSSVDELITGCVFIQGYLNKQGARRKTWKRRWFKVSCDKGLCSLSYASSEDERPIRVITITSSCRAYMGFCGKHAVRRALKHPALFSIETTSRVFCLEAPISEEAQRWVDIINLQIASLSQGTTPEEGNKSQCSLRGRSATVNVVPTWIPPDNNSSDFESPASATSHVNTPLSPTHSPLVKPEPTSPLSQQCTHFRSSSPLNTEEMPSTLPPIAPQPVISPTSQLNQLLENTLNREEETTIRTRLLSKFGEFCTEDRELQQGLNKLGERCMLRLMPGSLTHSVVSNLGKCNFQWGLAIGEHCVALSAHTTVSQSSEFAKYSGCLTKIRVYFTETSGHGPESLFHFTYLHIAYNESISRLLFAQWYLQLANVASDGVGNALRTFLQSWSSLLTNVAKHLECTRHTQELDAFNRTSCVQQLYTLAFQKLQHSLWVNELSQMTCNWCGFLFSREPTPEENFARIEGKEVQANTNIKTASKLPSEYFFTVLTPTSLIFYPTTPDHKLMTALPSMLLIIPVHQIRKLDIVTKPNTFLKLTNFVTEPSPTSPLVTHILYSSSPQETSHWLNAITQAFQTHQQL
ncbi:hypothetical protein Pelo_364 [Pelomyxa schiedti]|nr:hypothetical protein Pelo_364 [Pelomyxa schiedti]